MLSFSQQLRPGDLIFTGTPTCVGTAHPSALVEGRINGLAPCVFKVLPPTSTYHVTPLRDGTLFPDYHGSKTGAMVIPMHT